jgi:hypothetical protein
VHCSEAGAFADGANPAMRGSAVEALAVTAAQDRAFAAFADGEVDASRRPWDERDGGGLVALAQNAQRAMAAFDAEVLDVGGARLTHSQPVQPEQHRQRGVLTVVLLCGEQKHAELGAVESSGVRRMSLRTPDILRSVRRDTSIDVGEAIEAAHRREAMVDRRRHSPRSFIQLRHSSMCPCDVKGHGTTTQTARADRSIRPGDR